MKIEKVNLDKIEKEITSDIDKLRDLLDNSNTKKEKFKKNKSKNNTSNK